MLNDGWSPEPLVYYKVTHKTSSGELKIIKEVNESLHEIWVLITNWRQVRAQISLCISTVLLEPSFLTHRKT